MFKLQRLPRVLFVLCFGYLDTCHIREIHYVPFAGGQDSDFWSCYQNAFPMQIENECELLPILALVFLSVLHFLDSDPWVSSQCKEPLLRCMCPIAFRRHIMHCRRVSSSAWIMQTWWTINLSLWIWSCWCFSLLGNSLRNIKPSFFEVSPNYFFRQEKKKYYVS